LHRRRGERTRQLQVARRLFQEDRSHVSFAIGMYNELADIVREMTAVMSGESGAWATWWS